MDQTSLRDTMVWVFGPGLESRKVGDIDDHPTPIPLEEWRRCLREEERPLQVDPEDMVPLLLCYPEEGGREIGRRIVDEDIESTEGLGGLIDQLEIGRASCRE